MIDIIIMKITILVCEWNDDECIDVAMVFGFLIACFVYIGIFILLIFIPCH